MKSKRLIALMEKRGKKVPTAKDRTYDRTRGQKRGLALPDLTAATARDLALLLMAGVPPERACRYINPEYAAHLDLVSDEGRRTKGWKTWISRCLNSPLLVTATTNHNGAEWQHLDSDRRLQIAYDKHLAELAFLLYSNNYNDKDAPINRMDSARGAIAAHLEGGNEQPDSSWMAFLKDMMAGKVDAVDLVLPSAVPSDTGKKKES